MTDRRGFDRGPQELQEGRDEGGGDAGVARVRLECAGDADADIPGATLEGGDQGRYRGRRERRAYLDGSTPPAGQADLVLAAPEASEE